MATVALIGADGTGKTTISQRLQELQTPPIKCIYMGINPESSNHLLPTTRLMLKLKHAAGMETNQGGPPDPADRTHRPRGLLKRAASGLKSNLRLANQICEEWFRQCLSWYYQSRGFLVLFDRHFYSDYYAHDIAGENSNRPLGRRLHGFMLNRFYPRPDLVILLDAPGEVLFSRKSEGTVDLLEQRRQEYFQIRDQVKHFTIVNANQPLEDVVRDVTEIIRDFSQGKNGRVP